MTKRNREYKKFKRSSSSLPWTLLQTWSDLLFMHLPVCKDEIRKFVPNELEIDTYHGKAYITILTFSITNTRTRYIPKIPLLHSFLQINVRTYVKSAGKPGVYFFRFDANRLLTVLGARLLKLPYNYARMKLKPNSEDIQFTSTLKDARHRNMDVRYRLISELYYPEESSLSYWLLERYYSWVILCDRLYEVKINHPRWEIQDVDVYIQNNSILPNQLEETVKGSPLFTYAPMKQAHILSFNQITGGSK